MRTLSLRNSLWTEPDSARRFVLLAGTCLLALVLITFAIPLGNMAQPGAGELSLSLALWAVILLLSAVAGYLGFLLGAIGFALLVALAGPKLADAFGPSPPDEYIAVLSAPIVLLPILLIPGVLGALVRLWK